MSMWENKDHYLETVYRKHLVTNKKLTDMRAIDTEQFNKVAHEYLQSTEQLCNTLDRYLSIQRTKPLVFSKKQPIKFNPIFKKPSFIATILTFFLTLIISIVCIG